MGKTGRAGRKSLLDTNQLHRLAEILRRGPELYGYEKPLWTCVRVTHVIKQEFGVEYHPRHVWKILRKLNWSSTAAGHPVGERNEDASNQYESN
jgi:transposase